MKRFLDSTEAVRPAPEHRTGPRLLVSVAEAAHMTGLSERTVVRLYQRGEWPSLKIGTRRLIVVRGVLQWIEDKAS